MSALTPSASHPVQLDELPRPQVTLTAAQAHAVQGGGALKTIAAAQTDYYLTAVPSLSPLSAY